MINIRLQIDDETRRIAMTMQTFHRLKGQDMVLGAMYQKMIVAGAQHFAQTDGVRKILEVGK